MKFRTKLYQHQKTAIDKLSKIKVGALYMEQGTGKTRTALELVQRRLDAGKIDAVLWLCPCSVKKNLKEDIIYHTGDMPNNIVIRGIESLSSSDRLYLQLLKLVKQHKVYLIVDESNLVKNGKATRTARIIEIAKSCHYKLILNGTPVSKNEADMFAQWYILDWRILGYKSYYSFAANHIEYWTIHMPNGVDRIDHNRIKRVLNIDYLTEKIEPYTYQVKKSECLDLPKKNYHTYYCSLPDEQSDIYDETKEIYLMRVDEIKSETIYKLFTALQHVVSGRKVISKPEERMRTIDIYKSYLNNPRIKTLDNLLDDQIRDDKCIIFAKYQAELDEIAKLLEHKGRSYVMFTGQVPQAKRQENRDKFKADVQFLLANKSCGAYGLNLQFCHNVIYYSNDFDLATRMQSEDRVHRIGQEHEVDIYDIDCTRSIDDFIIQCLTHKTDMVEAFKREIDKWKKSIPSKTSTKQPKSA